LRLAPRDFWALSLKEWRALCEGGAPRCPPPSRDDLETLMQRYPD
jgi:uncharacterized phage protein (TIGR02216 family)